MLVNIADGTNHKSIGFTGSISYKSQSQWSVCTYGVQAKGINPFTPELKKCILPTFQIAIVWVM